MKYTIKEELLYEIYNNIIYNEDIILLENIKLDDIILLKVEDRKIYYHTKKMITSIFYFEMNQYLYVKDVPALEDFFLKENNISLLDLQFIKNKFYEFNKTKIN